MMKKWIAAIGSACVMLLSACGSNGDGGDPPVDSNIASAKVLDGNNQAAVVASELPIAVAVQVLNAAGTPVAGKTVNFVVTSGGGSVFAGSATSDSNGQARERWTLGTNAAAAQALEVRTVGADGKALVLAIFNATARAAAASQIVAVSGNGQTAPQAQPLPNVVVLAVQDRFGNGVAGADVSMTANGGGSVNPSLARSDAAGRVQGAWTLGTPIGTQTLTANTTGAAALQLQASATQAPVGAPARVVLSTGNNQSVAQHALLPQPLEVWVTDALGNGIPGVTVTFAPAAGSPYFASGSATTAAPLNDAGGYGAWATYFHNAGVNLVTATVAGLPPVTFTVNVTPTVHPFDGAYVCTLNLPNTAGPAPTGTHEARMDMQITNGAISGGLGNGYDILNGATVDEVSGALNLRLLVQVLDSSIADLTGQITTDAQQRASVAGTLTQTVRGLGVLGPHPWGCARQ